MPGLASVLAGVVMDLVVVDTPAGLEACSGAADGAGTRAGTTIGRAGDAGARGATAAWTALGQSNSCQLAVGLQIRPSRST